MSRLFLLTALVALATGSLLGLHLALGLAGLTPMEHWAVMLSSHATLQVHAFMVMLVLGMAMLVLPKFLEVPLAVPGVALLSWALLTTSVVLNLMETISLLPRLLEGASVIAFLVVLRKTRASAAYHEVDPKERRINRLHAGFMATGAIWLVISLIVSEGRSGQELILWGFASMYVAGIGLRVHPQMLGLALSSPKPFLYSLLLWNLGLGVEGAGYEAGRLLLCAGAALYLIGLNPFRRPSVSPEGALWLRSYLHVAYGWLGITILVSALAFVIDKPTLTAAALHLLSSGFLLTMIFGMAFEIISTHGGYRLVLPQAIWPILVLLTVGGALRMVGHIEPHWKLFGAGASCQIAASLLFCLAFGLTLLRGLPKA